MYNRQQVPGLREQEHARDIAFLGIVIRMFAEPDVQHHRPNFHAYYQDAAAAYAVDVVERIGGHMPRRQQRLIEAWAGIHQHELLEDWHRLQAGKPPYKIDPLR